jgi:hypothetical protein
VKEEEEEEGAWRLGCFVKSLIIKVCGYHGGRKNLGDLVAL